MTKEKQYFGFKFHERRGLDLIEGIKVCNSLEEFEGREREPVEEKLAPSDTESSSKKSCKSENEYSFETVADGFFHSMIGFYDVMRVVRISYIVTSTVNIRHFIEGDVSKISLAKHSVGDWQAYEIDVVAAPKLLRELRKLTRQLTRIIHHGGAFRWQRWRKSLIWSRE